MTYVYRAMMIQLNCLPCYFEESTKPDGSFLTMRWQQQVLSSNRENKPPLPPFVIRVVECVYDNRAHANYSLGVPIARKTELIRMSQAL